MIKVYNTSSFILSFACADVSEHTIQSPGNHSKEGNSIHNIANI